VPLYEYRCRECDERFELRRSFDDADAPAACPSGHHEAVRLLPVFASVGRSGGPASSTTAAPAMPRGCGGACACHPG
jgi:putative FmdB family regulatory protein